MTSSVFQLQTEDIKSVLLLSVIFCITKVLHFQKECGLFDCGLEPRRAHCYFDIISDRLPEPQ